MGVWADELAKLYPDSHAVERPVYAALLGALGSVLDQFDPVQIGLAAEFSVTRATGSALDSHGADWGVPRRSGEGDEAYRARILAQLAVYANGASVLGISGAVAAFTGASPIVIDCSEDGWSWGDSAWADNAWADAAGYFLLVIYVQNPNAVAYSHYDMQYSLRRAMPARTRAFLYHNGEDTSTLGQASDARVVIES